jgi:hypothetical protein
MNQPVLKIVLVVIAVLIGVALIADIATGKISPTELAGAGIICAAVATVL